MLTDPKSDCGLKERSLMLRHIICGPLARPSSWKPAIAGSYVPRTCAKAATYRRIPSIGHGLEIA